jgi:GH15 family glucan-1,4-alpha-glucosidase
MIVFIKKIALFSVSMLGFYSLTYSQTSGNSIEPSFFKLTTSNGLIVAIYNAKENRIDDVYPHIFANYDSGRYVSPFAGNITLNCHEQPLNASYLGNTHVIEVKYNDFSVNYFASFTRNDIIFYAVIRGEYEKIKNLNFIVERGNGAAVSGLSLLENHLQDLPIHIKGNLLSGNFLKCYPDKTSENYFLFSYTDSLQKDTTIVQKAIASLSVSKGSLLNEEVDFMRKLFSSCTIPKQLSGRERKVVEQSISILKMSQVSDKEIFPDSHGQIMASIRPGLWHIAWVRDASFAIQAMTRLGMFAEAKNGLEFMLKAPSGQYRHYIWKDGKDYGPGIDYRISLTRYFGNGREECDFNESGPNIEYDDFGLFMIAFTDYMNRSKDSAFLQRWEKIVSEKIADATVHCIDTDSLIKADSGPWEHHLAMPKQYTFTSGACARGLEQYAILLKQYHKPYQKYLAAAEKLKQGLLLHMLCDQRYFKGNVNDQLKTDYEYYDAGSFEVFSNGLIRDKKLFQSHMNEYDKVLRIKGSRPGYIRLNSHDPYENQEWVFINLRIAMAYILFGQKQDAETLLNFVTEEAAINFNTIPEMYSNKLQMERVSDNFRQNNVWCNCIRDQDNQYIGTISMVGYGSGTYILTLFAFYGL